MWKRLETKDLLKHPRLTVVEDSVELPSGQVVPYLRFDDESQSVCTVCVQDGQVLVAREYSYPPNEVLYQFPGGGVNQDEPPAKSAERELVEECGYAAGKLTELGWFYTNNRRTAQKMYVYLAENLTPTQKRGGDMEEDTTQEWINIDTFRAMVTEGKIHNFSMLASWALWENKK
jgi:ADP-ribose pyrophosphatase